MERFLATSMIVVSLGFLVFIGAAMCVHATPPQEDPPAVPIRTFVNDVFQTANQQTFTLSQMPDISRDISVYLNGALQLQGLDYTLVGQHLMFLPAQPVGDGPVIQVKYSPIIAAQ
jgi:hypothetical protein